MRSQALLRTSFPPRLRYLKLMTNYERENKAETTHREFHALISAQDVARDAKTARLRELRLSRDAELAASKNGPKPIAPRKRKKPVAKIL